MENFEFFMLMVQLHKIKIICNKLTKLKMVVNNRSSFQASTCKFGQVTCNIPSRKNLHMTDTKPAALKSMYDEQHSHYQTSCTAARAGFWPGGISSNVKRVRKDLNRYHISNKRERISASLISNISWHLLAETLKIYPCICLIDRQ